MLDPACLAIGTQVSAKYKGAYCEAKVRTVDKLLKVRVSFKSAPPPSTSNCQVTDKDIVSIVSGGSSDGQLAQGAIVTARHPDTREVGEAVVKQIQDHSKYTVIFNDGDIATLKRNALCMKSGKHYNASESLDNLPLTHPEHFSSPASLAGLGNRGSNKRRHRSGGGQGNHDGNDDDDDDDDDSSSDSNCDDDLVNDHYSNNIGRVVWAENTDKKTKAKDSWFLALIVAPSASDTAKIRTKKEFLIRSFKDGRFYTVSKKDTSSFKQSESPSKKSDNPNLREAMERALTYLETKELPTHWDRDILINHGGAEGGGESTNNSTTASSEEELDDNEDDDDGDAESPEEKDHLVAELFKHMEDRGQPIDKTPTIDGRDVDLYKLFRIVARLGGHARVSNKKLWRQVAKRLGFETAWCVNQVRVHYKRFLQSFEEINRTLGCTLVKTGKSSVVRNRQSSGSKRVQVRGSSRAVATNPSNVVEITDNDSGPAEQTVAAAAAAEPKQPDPVEPPSQVGKRKVKKGRDEAVKGRKDEAKMTTRPRRDSSSSLAAAMQVKAQKDGLGGEAGSKGKPVVRVDRDKETENEAKKLAVADQSKDHQADEAVAAAAAATPGKKGGGKKTEDKRAKGPPNSGSSSKSDAFDDDDEDNEAQHLGASIDVAVNDRIRVFYKFDVIYEAKVKRVQVKKGHKWPRYFVHYQGWNARYDEWIKRSKIKENLSWNKDRVASQPDEEESQPAASKKPPPNNKTHPDKICEKPNVAQGPSKAAKAAKKEPSASATSRAGTPSRTSRTSSPALKRQTSRAGVSKKEGVSSSNATTTTDSDDDSESSTRKSRSRLQKPAPVVQQPVTPAKATSGANSAASSPVITTTKDPTTEGGRRSSNRKRPVKEEVSETEDVDVVKSEDVSPTKAKRGRKTKDDNSGSDESSAAHARRATPTRERTPSKAKTLVASATKRGRKAAAAVRPKEEEEEEEDVGSTSGNEDPYTFKEPDATETVPSKADKKLLSAKSGIESTSSSAGDSADSSSSDEAAKRSVTRTTRTGAKSTLPDEKDSRTSRSAARAEIKDEAPEIPAIVKKEDDEAKADVADAKPVLQFTKKQQELFPHLAAIRTSSVPGIISKRPVEEQPAVEPDDQPTSEAASPSSITAAANNSNRKQRKTPKKPNSSELVESESDDSESETEPKKPEPKVPSIRKAGSKRKLASNIEDEPRQAAAILDEDEPLLKQKRSCPTDKKSQQHVVKEDENEDLDLACNEAIPGSPVHSSSAAATPADSSAKTGSSKSALDEQHPDALASSSSGGPLDDIAASPASSLPAGPAAMPKRLEMPFASVPESVQEDEERREAPAGAEGAIPVTLPSSSTPTAALPVDNDAEAGAASPAQSSDKAKSAGYKSPGAESSEDVDMDSLKADSLDIEGSSSGDAAGARSGRKRKPVPEGSPSVTQRRKRRTRESSNLRGVGRGSGSRGRPANSALANAGPNDDTDESEERDLSSLAAIGSLDDDALAALAQRSPKSSKYNFYPDFNSTMDSNTRIALIQQNMKDLRKAYHSVKGKLASTERQLEKIRRKEREKVDESNKTAPIEASA